MTHHPRIIIFANVLDRAHDIMGFLPGWVRALQEQGADIRVIAQGIGTVGVDVPVVNLDKARHPGALGRFARTLKALWKFRNEYDVVFVVMAPTWAALLALPVRLLGKRIYLWYAVWKGSWKLRVAERLVNGIFCSVPESFPFASPKVRAVGQAIDTDRFTPDGARRVPGQVLFVGRISPVKRVEVLLEALAQDARSLGALSVVIAGGPVSAGDRAYEQDLRTTAHRLGIADSVVWLGRVGHETTHDLYRRADIVVNMTPAGSFDKTILEAMASGAIVIVSNPALRRFLPDAIARRVIVRQDDPADLARALADISGMPDGEKDAVRAGMREAVATHHSLSQWTKNIIKNLE